MDVLSVEALRASQITTEIVASTGMDGGSSAPVPHGPATNDRTAPATPPESFTATLLRAWRESAWSPIVLRIVAIAGGMLLLAAIGAVATLRGVGTPLDDVATQKASIAGEVSSWLAPDPPGAGKEPRAVAQTAPGAADAGPAPDAGSAPGVTADGKVILNQAGFDDLRHLPGIGPKRAQAILDLKKRLGRFRKGTELLRVRGIGPRTLRKLQPHFVIDAPKAPAKDGG